MKPWDSKWTVGSDVGRGGQGVTKLVRSRIADITGVLKTILPHKKQNDAARGRMHREVAALQSLSVVGAKVPTVLDHNTGDLNSADEFYMVMEYVQGPHLEKFIEDKGPVDFETARAIALSICETIGIGHGENTLHRDIKPDNVILRDEKFTDAVILDYGLSFNSEDDEITAATETIRNKFLDLPETVVPGGNRRDSRSDITAVAAILWFCLCGKKPGQLFDQDGLPPHKRSVYQNRCKNEKWFSAVDRLFIRAFQNALNNRFQQIGEFSTALSEIAMTGEFSITDPISYAKTVSDQIRQNDWPTIRAKMKKDAGIIEQAVNDQFQNWYDSLGNFRVSRDIFRDRFIFPCPQGVEEVATCDYPVWLMLDNHNNRFLWRYKIISDRTDCIILVQDTHSAAHPHAFEHPPSEILPSFRELVRYRDPSDAVELVKSDLDEWLRKVVRTFAGIILEK